MAPYLDDVSSPAPPIRAQPAPRPAAGRDDLDDLFDDAGLDDIFRDLTPPRATVASEVIRKSSTGAGVGAGLGIDKEVEVVKKPMAPRVKLDENRLLSQAGIPKLRRRAKDLKFKGKGHEYSDAARLLQFYQLWLDDLFPKAKFLDAIAMVEKLGHKRRIQLMRMDWINEGKPKDPEPEADIFGEPTLPRREVSELQQQSTTIAPIFEKRKAERPKTPDINENMDEDIYDATPKALRKQAENTSVDENRVDSIFGAKKTVVPEEPEDDLDALLAEHELEQMTSRNGTGMITQNNSITEQEENFDDEMEAMAEMGGMW